LRIWGIEEEEEEEEMYRERGSGGSKMTEVGPVDRKRINDALDKQLERSSPSTSRAAINGKDKPLIMGGKGPSDHRDSRSASASLSKTNCSDGLTFSFFFHIYEFNFMELGNFLCSSLRLFIHFFLKEIIFFRVRCIWGGGMF
jgi:hypothetical protein